MIRALSFMREPSPSTILLFSVAKARLVSFKLSGLAVRL
jgi:hypothetical protein